MRRDVCPKKDVIEAALESELRDAIGVPVDTFMHKYFPKWNYLKASSNSKPILATDDLLHNILSNYLYASKEDMGIDNYFKQQTKKNGIKKMLVRIDHNQVAAQTMPRYFQLDELLCLRKSITGRASRIWACSRDQ